MPTLHLGPRTVDLGDELILGRHKHCGLQIPDAAASRQHARILQQDGQCFVEDLNSNNGTTLNGEMLRTRARLRHGDHIGIGLITVEFRSAPDASQEPAIATEAIGLVGRTIAGYRLDEMLAKGPTGVVFRAEQLSMKRAVAFKIIAPELSRAEVDFPERFLTAAGKAGSIRDQGLVQVHESGRDPERSERLWYSMELVRGDNFDTLLARDGTIEPGLALLVAERAALALLGAHQVGVFHHDLRPAVLLLTPEGEVKICDTGLAEVFGRGHRLLVPRLRSRTPASALWYLAPEQLRGKIGDARSDIYGLGCVLFHLLTGRPPFEGANASEVREGHLHEEIPSACDAVPGLPKAVDEQIQGMLTKNPEWRFNDCRELSRALRAARELMQQSPAPAVVDRAAHAKAAAQRAHARTAQRRWAQVARFCGVLLVLGGFAVVMAWVFLAPRRNMDLPEVVYQPKIVRDPTWTGGHTPPASTAPVTWGSAQTSSAATPSPGASAAEQAWLATRQRADALATAQSYAAAERLLREGLDALRTANALPRVLDQAKLHLADLQTQAGTWYRAEVARLPQGASAQDQATRIAGFARLRDAACEHERRDAESQYQIAFTRLSQTLLSARRDARVALEAGRASALTGIAAGIATAFRGTPIAGLQREFAALCGEAARLETLGLSARWRGNAGAALPAEQALAVAAALLLSGDAPAAKKTLAAATGFGDPLLLRRREALLGREAAVLTFDDSGDLHYIDAQLGDLTLRSGTLIAPTGDAVTIACSVAVGGAATWSTSLTLRWQGTGEAQLSIVQAGTTHARIAIEAREATALLREAGTNVLTSAGRVGDLVKLRLTARDGRVAAWLDGRQIAESALTVPAASNVVFEAAAGGTWAIDEWQVLAE